MEAKLNFTAGERVDWIAAYRGAFQRNAAAHTLAAGLRIGFWRRPALEPQMPRRLCSRASWVLKCSVNHLSRRCESSREAPSGSAS